MIDKIAGLAEILIDSAKLPWREKSLSGLSEKMLWRDEATGASIALIRIAKGAGIPEPHRHASNQFMYCLSGRYEYTATGVVLTAGSFYCNPKGLVHGPAVAHEETIVLEIYDGPHYPERPAFYTRDEDAR
jgi:quercetin dioxygenase-like cupin family protein